MRDDSRQRLDTRGYIGARSHRRTDGRASVHRNDSRPRERQREGRFAAETRGRQSTIPPARRRFEERPRSLSDVAQRRKRSPSNSSESSSSSHHSPPGRHAYEPAAARKQISNPQDLALQAAYAANATMRLTAQPSSSQPTPQKIVPLGPQPLPQPSVQPPVNPMVEQFLAMNPVEDHAAARLRSLPQHQQAQIINKSLSGARAPTGVLISRIRRVTEFNPSESFLGTSMYSSSPSVLSPIMPLKPMEPIVPSAPQPDPREIVRKLKDLDANLKAAPDKHGATNAYSQSKHVKVDDILAKTMREKMDSSMPSMDGNSTEVAADKICLEAEKDTVTKGDTKVASIPYLRPFASKRRMTAAAEERPVLQDPSPAEQRETSVDGASGIDVSVASRGTTSIDPSVARSDATGIDLSVVPDGATNIDPPVAGSAATGSDPSANPRELQRPKAPPHSPRDKEISTDGPQTGQAEQSKVVSDSEISQDLQALKDKSKGHGLDKEISTDRPRTGQAVQSTVVSDSEIPKALQALKDKSVGQGRPKATVSDLTHLARVVSTDVQKALQALKDKTAGQGTAKAPVPNRSFSPAKPTCKASANANLQRDASASGPVGKINSVSVLSSMPSGLLNVLADPRNSGANRKDATEFEHQHAFAANSSKRKMSTDPVVDKDQKLEDQTGKEQPRLQEKIEKTQPTWADSFAQPSPQPSSGMPSSSEDVAVSESEEAYQRAWMEHQMRAQVNFFEEQVSLSMAGSDAYSSSKKRKKGAWQPRMPGDWDCSKCGDHQFSRNMMCKNCGAWRE